MACGVLVPWPGIEPRPLEVKSWSPNHGTARESLQFNSYTCIYDGSIEMKNWGSETWCELLKIAEWDELKKSLLSLLVGRPGGGLKVTLNVVGLWRRGLKHFFLPFLLLHLPKGGLGLGVGKEPPEAQNPPPHELPCDVWSCWGSCPDLWFPDDIIHCRFPGAVEITVDFPWWSPSPPYNMGARSPGHGLPSADFILATCSDLRAMEQDPAAQTSR